MRLASALIGVSVFVTGCSSQERVAARATGSASAAKGESPTQEEAASASPTPTATAAASGWHVTTIEPGSAAPNDVPPAKGKPADDGKSGLLDQTKNDPNATPAIPPALLPQTKLPGPEKPEEKRKARASVRAASTESLSGQFTPEQLERAVADNVDAFAHCSDGDVTVSLHALIAATGKVVSASSTRSVPDDAKMRDCVLDAFRTIQFPASHDGKSSPITFDLVLSAPS